MEQSIETTFSTLKLLLDVITFTFFLHHSVCERLTSAAAQCRS